MEPVISGYDYLDIHVEAGKLVVTLNWEKLSIDPSRVKGFKFQFDGDMAIQIDIQLDTTTMTVPIKLKPADAALFEKKKKQVFKEIKVIHKKSYPQWFYKLWISIFKR